MFSLPHILLTLPVSGFDRAKHFLGGFAVSRVLSVAGGGASRRVATATLLVALLLLTGFAGVMSAATAATPSAPIVFSSLRDGNSELYAVQPDGSGLRRLTNHKALDAFPSLSPDGTRVAFVSTRNGNSELYVMNLDGTGLVRLTNHTAIDTDPDWSPDGTRIAFTSRRTGNGDIYTLNSSDGSGLTRLSTHKSTDTSPAWSPDGTQLAFVSLRSGLGDVYVMKADGSGQLRLTTSILPDLYPAWSPDGGKLAFASLRSGFSDIYTMNPDGSQQLRLTRSAAVEIEPAWSPDGTELVIASSASGNFDLYRLKADGTGATVLAPHSRLDGSPDWAHGVAGPPVLPPLASLTITPTPETANAATATIGPLGGSIETTAADGTHFRLVVFAGALSADTALTITPAAVAGLDPIAEASPTSPIGIEFAPTGLSFAIPSVLIITPPAGSPFAPETLVATWSSGPGIELGLPQVMADGALRVSVPHFSGAVEFQARLNNYKDLLEKSIAALPDLGDDAQLMTHIAGMPATAQAVADDLQRLFVARITPALDLADDSIFSFVRAQDRVQDFGSIVQLFDLFDLVGAGGTETLGALYGGASVRLQQQGDTLRARYNPPGTATVTSVLDWFVVPLALDELIRLAGGTGVLPDFVVEPDVQVVSAFPAALQPDQTTVSAQFRAGVSAPAGTQLTAPIAGTPDGVPAGGRVFFAQQTIFNLTVSGGTFAEGGSTLVQTTGPDGLLSVEVNRTGEPRVTLTGTATIEGFLGVAIALVHESNVFPVRMTAAEPGFGLQYTLSPPVNQILEPGGTTNLSVLVTDVDQLPVENQTVTWILHGPGALSASSSVTVSNGIASIDYQHPAGIVTQSQSARIEAIAIRDGLERSDNVTLTPRWASLSIEAHPEFQLPFTAATNTTIQVLSGQRIVFRARLTGPGATPADPPVALTDAVSARIYEGGGQLLDMDNVPYGDLFLLLTDPADLHETTWDPLASTGDTTILFQYPAVIESQVPGIAATVTLTPAVQVSVLPNLVNLAPLGTQQFTATVTGATNTDVTWSATGAGAITSGGLYTAPALAGTYTITATSVEDPTKSGTATVTVEAPGAVATLNYTYGSDAAWGRVESLPGGVLAGTYSEQHDPLVSEALSGGGSASGSGGGDVSIGSTAGSGSGSASAVWGYDVTTGPNGITMITASASAMTSTGASGAAVTYASAMVTNYIQFTVSGPPGSYLLYEVSGSGYTALRPGISFGPVIFNTTPAAPGNASGILPVGVYNIRIELRSDAQTSGIPYSPPGTVSADSRNGSLTLTLTRP